MIARTTRTHRVEYDVVDGPIVDVEGDAYRITRIVDDVVSRDGDPTPDLHVVDVYGRRVKADGSWRGAGRGVALESPVYGAEVDAAVVAILTETAR